jgi:hypothetical protein
MLPSLLLAACLYPISLKEYIVLYLITQLFGRL